MKELTMNTAKKLCAIALALTCVQAATLRAQDLYISNSGNNTIGEYGLDGATIDGSFHNKILHFSPLSSIK